MKSLKILVVGDGHSKIHEVAVAEAFASLGHQVKTFYWSPYLTSRFKIAQLFLSAQNKFIIGPAIQRINRDLGTQARDFRPDVIFIYRGTHINRRTIQRLKKHLPGTLVLGYNNDDPFAPGHPDYLWKTFQQAVPFYDIIFAYRHHNIPQFQQIGARRVELLRSWFLPWANRPIGLKAEEQARFQSDVVFIGHHEADGRKEQLEAIVRKGWKFRLFGPAKAWNSLLPSSTELKNQVPVGMVWGDDYNRALCGSKIALCFLSKLNRDTYTRRCFEIPASGTFMLSEYTDDLAGLFTPGLEADYFRTQEELLAKIEYYLAHDDQRLAIAQAGFKKVFAAGHDIVSRMQYVLDIVKSEIGEAR